jgi:hypothetical protein
MSAGDACYGRGCIAAPGEAAGRKRGIGAHGPLRCIIGLVNQDTIAYQHSSSATVSCREV